ncbi:hypothetical protein SSPIM334S_02379 [Streptomyces spiroverticillatus]
MTTPLRAAFPPKKDEDEDQAAPPAADGPPADEDQGDEDEGKKRKVAARTVGGQILEYGVRSRPGGPFSSVTFAPGSLEFDGDDMSHVKLLRDHDTAQPLGVMTSLSDTETGADGEFRLGRHAAADEALMLAADGVLDGLSVGVEPLEWDDDADEKGVTVTRAALREVSLVALPAYSRARASRVTATGRPAMTTETPTAPETRPDADVEALVRRILAERAPAESAPLLPADGPAPTPTISAAHVVDREGYGRTLPAVVVGRERVDAADYLSASLELMVNGNAAPFERVRQVIQAATPVHETTELVPGLLPQVITGPLLDQLVVKRPVWQSLTPRTMPSGSGKFSRARVKQHTQTGEQTAEKSELVNRPMKIDLEEIAKSTYGGWVNISRQVIDWTSPGALALIVQDLTENLMADAETIATAALVAAATDKVESAYDDPAKLNAAIYQAAAKVYGANKNQNVPADRVWMSPDVWATIGAMVDGNKRPLFPALSPSNALGSLRPANPTGGDFGGLSVVVSGKLPEKTLIVGASEAIEVYEDQRGTLQAVEPSVLGVQVAAYAYYATYAPQPGELVAIGPKASGGGG